MSNVRNVMLCCGFVAVLLLVVTESTRAQVSNFTGLGDGINWTDPLNWDAGEPSGLATDAVIIGAPLSPLDVQLNAARSVRTLTLGASDTLRLLDGSSLTFSLPFINTNDGVIRLESGASNTDLRTEGTLSLRGTGSVEMIGPNARILDEAGALDGALLNDEFHLIHGQGQIGADRTRILNLGIIRADVNGATLTLDPDARDMSNGGGAIVESANGATLQLNPGRYLMPTGIINAQTGSNVKLMGGSFIINGTLSSLGTGVIETGDATIVAVTTVAVDGLLRINDGHNLDLSFTIRNQPTSVIQINSGASNTDLLIEGHTVLIDGGTVEMVGANARILDESGLAQGFLDNTNNLIHGQGQIGANRLQLRNGGTIAADVAGTTLAIDVDARGFVNTGTVRADNGATLHIADFFSSSGPIVASAGSIVQVDGVLTTQPTGSISGEGTILVGPTGNTDLLNGGTIAPGVSTGTLNIEARTVALSGNLAIELGGNIQGVDYDLLDIQGGAILGGALDVSLFGVFAPSLGDTFDILTTTGTLTGTFDSVNLSSAPGTATGVFYGSNFVRLTVGLVGDLDLDGFVGITDLNIVLSHWNQNVGAGSLLLGDPSGDSFVGIEDLNVVLGNWNAGTPPPPADALALIPEPTTAGLLMVGAGVLAGRRKR